MIEPQNNISELLNRLLVQGNGSSFYSFSNIDGKRWLMPDRNMRTALNLYQPSSLKGKMVKQYLPYLKNIGFVRRKLGIEKQRFELISELNNLLCELFQTKKIEFSIFCGTPSVHQKITIQISEGQNILGYCKVTDKNAIKEIFDHEQQILSELSVHGISNIPACLYNGSLEGGIHLFVQNTIKTNASKIPLNWSIIHWGFLNQMQVKTKLTLPFEQTDFCKAIEKLTIQLNRFSSRDAKVIADAIDVVQKTYKNKEVTFSAYHGDFTPWNIFFENNEIFVFDWEYSKLTCPPNLDVFHFITQKSLLVDHLTCSQIFNNYRTRKNILSSHFSNSDMAFTCYLLLAIELYLSREELDSNDSSSILLKKWVSLIELMQTEN